MESRCHISFIALLLCTILFLGGCSAVGSGEGSTAERETRNETVESSSSETGNVFLDAEIDYWPITNSAKTKVVGKRASISVSKDDALASTSEDLVAFARDVVEDSEFNWWTVIFDDGTGIVFNGSSILAPEYGKVARDGTVYEAYGALFLGDDDLYSYKEYDD